MCQILHLGKKKKRPLITLHIDIWPCLACQVLFHPLRKAMPGALDWASQRGWPLIPPPAQCLLPGRGSSMDATPRAPLCLPHSLCLDQWVWEGGLTWLLQHHSPSPGGGLPLGAGTASSFGGCCLSLHLILGFRQEGPPSVFLPLPLSHILQLIYQKKKKKVAIFTSTHHFFHFRFAQNPGGKSAGLFRRPLRDDERTPEWGSGTQISTTGTDTQWPPKCKFCTQDSMVPSAHLLGSLLLDLWPPRPATS